MAIEQTTNRKTERVGLKKEAKQMLKTRYGWSLLAYIIPGIIAEIPVVGALIFLSSVIETAAQNTYSMSDLGYEAYKANAIYGGPSAAFHALTDNGLFGQIIAPLMLVLLVTILLEAFISEPINSGACGAYAHSLRGEMVSIKEIFSRVFNKNYMNTVICLFMQSVIIFAFTLLLIVPGIMKAYQYYAVPYILRDDPELSWKEVLKTSTDIMTNKKMDAFILDLSFIGWYLLSAMLPLNILAIFFVIPYQYITRAAFYNMVAERNEELKRKIVASKEIASAKYNDENTDDTAENVAAEFVTDDANANEMEKQIPEEENRQSEPEDESLAQIEQTDTEDVVHLNMKYVGTWHATSAMSGDETFTPKELLGEDMSFTAYEDGRFVLTLGNKTKTCKWTTPEENHLQMQGYNNYVFTEMDNCLILAFESASIRFEKLL